jgi:N-acetylglucosaminyldiphosphoundecaprenol N-acetyl-beta-D-mannosaminyltransferase
MEKRRSVPVPLVLYGVPFHNVSFEEAMDWIVARVRSGRPANIATANLDFVTQAWSDPELQRILIDADLVLADGFPVVKLAPFFGPKLKGRVSGSDLTPSLAARAEREGLRIYGLGGGEGVAERAMAALKEQHPKLNVAGIFSPPYLPLLEMDHQEILRKLEQAAPDILFVAFGAPKQEKFISMHVRGWNVPVAMGVGASLDFIAGEQKRAPVWIQRLCLEWLWRLCSNPKRLINRYLSNQRFLISASEKMISIRCMADRPVTFDAMDEPALRRLEGMGVAVEHFQQLGDESIAAAFIERLGTTGSEKHILLDLHAAPWLDSLELGALLEVSKACRSHDRRLILYAPRPKVRRLLETCRLIDYFDTAVQMDAVDEIVQLIREHSEGGTLHEGGTLRLDLPVELTAATLPEFEQQAEFIHHELREQGILKTVEVDAAQLDFIDSSGLGFLISLKKATLDEGVSMSIVNLSEKPRRTFEIARVDQVLLRS